MTDEELRAALEVTSPDKLVEYINLLVYGDPGVGKTVLMGTAFDDERTMPMLAFDVEGGLVTLRKKQGIDVIRVRSMKDVVDKYNIIYKASLEGNMLYKTIGIDSLTELADLDIKEIIAKDHKSNPEKFDKDTASQRAWGQSRTHMRSIVRAFRDLPCNVIFTASMGTLQDEGMPNKNFPAFSGKLRTEIPGFMDIVGMLSTKVHPVSKEVERKLQVLGTDRVIAKDRTDALGVNVSNPSIPMLWDMIHNSNDSQISGSAASQSAP